MDIDKMAKDSLAKIKKNINALAKKHLHAMAANAMAYDEQKKKRYELEDKDIRESLKKLG